MPSFANVDDEDVFGSSSSHFLSPAMSSHKSPSRQVANGRRSPAPPRGTTNHNVDNGQHSLAHELAFAMMPEPNASSRLLAEEFGIDYDEGAEGIDEHSPNDKPQGNELSFTDKLDSQEVDASLDSGPSSIIGDDSSQLSASPALAQIKQPRKPELDAMEVLAQNLESTEKFLSHLRQIDVDSSLSTSQPTLEKLASEIIRRLNDTARDRETQVRELLGYEREFRKISGEIGGNDVLGQLDELEDLEETAVKEPSTEDAHSDNGMLDAIAEEPAAPCYQRSNEWGMDADFEEDEVPQSEELLSPTKESFPTPPPVVGSLTPTAAIPQLAHIRTFTTSLVSSLTTISEQAQVNGAATTEAGRKIRALKNKIGGWRIDSDSAERSRLRIERWEAGIADVDPVSASQLTPGRSRRVDGRKLVQEHLHAFERAIEIAAQRTQAIMAGA